MPDVTKALTIRLQILQGRGLAPKDKNGLSDPYAIVTFGKRKHTTCVVYESLEPTWNYSFDFPVHVQRLPSSLSIVVWDYNRLRHVYMGEVHIPLHDLFDTDKEPLSFHASREYARWYPLETGTGKRANAVVSGEILINTGFVVPSAELRTSHWEAQWHTLIQLALAGTNTPQELPSDLLSGEDEEDDSAGDPFSLPQVSPSDSETGVKTPRMAPTSSPKPTPLNHSLSDLANSPNEPTKYIPLWESLKLTPLHLRTYQDPLANSSLQKSLAALKTSTKEGHSPELHPGTSPKMDKSDLPGEPSSSGPPVPVPEPRGSQSLEHTPRKGSDGSGDTLQMQELPLPPSTSSHATTPSQTSVQSTANVPSTEIKGPQGVIYIEINSASDLPRVPNIMRTSFDMDPFVVIGFSRKTWRTTTKRHILNPQWNEKLYFHISAHESNYPLKFSVYDYDKMSNNDHIGTAELSVGHVVRYFEAQYSAIEAQHSLDKRLLPYFDMEDLDLNLQLSKKSWQDQHDSQLHVRISYAPYPILRRKFWLAMCRQYDSDENGCMNLMEIQTLLDSLGSTVTDETMEGFFTRMNKSPDQDELEFGEFIGCLEDFLTRPISRSHSEDLLTRIASPLTTPTMLPAVPPVEPGDLAAEDLHTKAIKNAAVAAETRTPAKESLGISLPSSPRSVADVTQVSGRESHSRSRASSFLNVAKKGSRKVLQAAKRVARSGSQSSVYNPIITPETERSHGMEEETGTGSQQRVLFSLGDSESPRVASPSPLARGKNITAIQAQSHKDSSDNDFPISSSPKQGHPEDISRESFSSGEGYDSSEEANGSGKNVQRSPERIFQASTCVVCQRFSLAHLSDIEVVNHVAECFVRASSRSSRERFVMGDFVTEAQAQRKWFTRLFKYVGYGGYRIGKNNANIIVINRQEGTQEEEKIPAYIRVGIRLLYRNIGSKSTAQQRKVRDILRSLSVKQGMKYDDPASARQIPSFIKFHNLNLDEVLLPLDQFKSFNEFFYRQLKPGARINPFPDNPHVALSPADCRLMVFNTVDEATRVWIKGRRFNLTRLLGNCEALAKEFEGGSLAVFRLAPQDYHRFHFPVDGTLLRSYVASDEELGETCQNVQQESKDNTTGNATASANTAAEKTSDKESTSTAGSTSPKHNGQSEHLGSSPKRDKIEAKVTKLEFPYLVPGNYYTVNPMAIRSRLDVYGENVRVINVIDSPQFGRVAFVSIGAMMVGSVVITSETGKTYKRMDEHGYFKFGGSTCVLLFQKDAMVFDDDLLTNSEVPIETLVKMGSTIGRSLAASSI
ncbi:phosphatidylserine decarboxylase [Dispira parvispora]|uniref:Phosphatidylserine decarboxylase n=1 Tax=Dispira parvispora TaxID=1520584 RepID=A0A9W8AVV2_9FUNG|nr:phosphatidylserine decarboxylase [Dispira parvispora]